MLFCPHRAYVERLCYNVKNWFILSTKHVNLSIRHVKRLCHYATKSGYLVYEAFELVCKRIIILNACFVLFTYCLILLKGNYVKNVGYLVKKTCLYIVLLC